MILFIVPETQSPALVLFQVLPSGLCGVGQVSLEHQGLKATGGKLLLRLGLRQSLTGPHICETEMYSLEA